jgi:hypothetical protein
MASLGQTWRRRISRIPQEDMPRRTAANRTRIRERMVKSDWVAETVVGASICGKAIVTKNKLRIAATIGRAGFTDWVADAFADTRVVAQCREDVSRAPRAFLVLVR